MTYLPIIIVVVISILLSKRQRMFADMKTFFRIVICGVCVSFANTIRTLFHINIGNNAAYQYTIQIFVKTYSDPTSQHSIYIWLNSIVMALQFNVIIRVIISYFSQSLLSSKPKYF